MGLFDITCIASGLPIRSGQPSRVVLVQKVGRHFVPVALPIAGKYDKLGGLEHIAQNEDTRRLVASFTTMFQQKRLSGGSLDDPLERPKNLKHLLEMIRQGAVDRSWIKVDDRPLEYAFIDEGIFRAAADDGRAPRGSLFRSAFGDVGLAAEIYGENHSGGRAGRLRELARFRRWFGPRPWKPDFGGGLFFIDDIEQAAAKARKQHQRSPSVVRAIDAHLAAAREESARDQLEEFFDSWLEDQAEAFTKRWKLEERTFPKPSSRSVALPSPRPGDIVLGSGPGDATTLEEAVRAVKPGGRILVRRGVYEHQAGIKTKKPFSLMGEGMARSVLVFETKQDALTLAGKGKWRLENVALIAQPVKKNPGVETLWCEGSVVECVSCLFGGARGATKRGITIGGGGVKASDGATVVLRNCDAAFCEWGFALNGATMLADGCRAYGCERGLITMKGGRARAIRSTFESNAQGAKTYGGPEVLLELQSCRVKMSWGAGVYAHQGSIRLANCEVVDGSGNGLVCEAGAEMVARRCKSRRNLLSGFHADGKVTLERCEASRNAKHGIELASKSEGTVKACRFTKNGKKAILRDPKSRVVIA